MLGLLKRRIRNKAISFLKEDSRWHMRKKAARLLAGKRNEEAVSALIGSLRDSNYYVREISQEGLAVTGDYAVPFLLKCLQGDDSDFLSRIASVLGEAGSQLEDKRPVLECLLNLSQKKNPWIRRGAVQGLGTISHDSVIDPLIKIAREDEDKWVSVQAISSLGMYSQRKAVKDVLISFLEDGEMDIKDEAVRTFIRMGKEAINPLLSYAKDKKAPLGSRMIAASALKDLGYKPDEAEIEIFFSILNRDLLSLVKFGKEGIQIFTAFLKEKRYEDFIVSWHISPLTKVGEQAVEILSTCARYGSSNFGVKEEARKILEQIGCKPVTVEEPDVSFIRKPGHRYFKRNFQRFLVLGKAKFQPGDKILTEREWEDLTRLTKISNDDPAMSIEDMVYNYVYTKQGQKLREIWDQTRFVLLLNHATYFSAFVAVVLGKEDMIPSLMDVLKETGDLNLAELFSNCGNSELQKLTETWAVANGYELKKEIGKSALMYNSWQR